MASTPPTPKENANAMSSSSDDERFKPISPLKPLYPPRRAGNSIPMAKQRSQPVLESSRREYVEGTPVPLEWIQDGPRAIVKAATLSQIVQQIAERGLDNVTLHHIIVAHGHFVPSVKLLEKIISEFTAPASSSQSLLHKHMRLINFLKLWFSLQGDHIAADEELRTYFDRFVEKIKKENEGLSSYLALSSKRPAAIDEAEFPESISPVLTNGKLAFVDCNPMEFARQLALKEHSLLAAVRLPEFHKARWAANNAPNLEACSEFTNATAYWLALQVVSESTVKGQLKAWLQVIAVGKCLYELQEWNALLAVVLALRMPQVTSLQQQWKAKDVPKKAQRQQIELDNAVQPLANFPTYRTEVRNQRGPMIPIYEVHLKDLLYATESQQDFTSPGVINFLKLDALGKLILPFVQAQQTPYGFHPESNIQELLRYDEIPLEQLQRELEQKAVIPTSPTSEGVELPRRDSGSSIKITDSYDAESSTAETDSASIGRSCLNASEGGRRLSDKGQNCDTIARELEKKLLRKEREWKRKEKEMKSHEEDLLGELDTMRILLERKNRDAQSKDRTIAEMRLRIEQLEQSLLVNTIKAAVAVNTAGGKTARYVTVRTLDMPEGGAKVPVPSTNAELIALGGHELGITGIKVRRLNYMRVEANDLKDGDTVYVTSDADERKLEILGL